MKTNGRSYLRAVIILASLLMPSSLSSIEPLHIPAYPVRILHACVEGGEGPEYLMFRPGGTIVKYD